MLNKKIHFLWFIIPGSILCASTLLFNQKNQVLVNDVNSIETSSQKLNLSMSRTIAQTTVVNPNPTLVFPYQSFPYVKIPSPKGFSEQNALDYINQPHIKNKLFTNLPPTANIMIKSGSYDNTTLAAQGVITLVCDCTEYYNNQGQLVQNTPVDAGWVINLSIRGFKESDLPYNDTFCVNITQLTNNAWANITTLDFSSTQAHDFLNQPNIKNMLFANLPSQAEILIDPNSYNNIKFATEGYIILNYKTDLVLVNNDILADVSENYYNLTLYGFNKTTSNLYPTRNNNKTEIIDNLFVDTYANNFTQETALVYLNQPNIKNQLFTNLPPESKIMIEPNSFDNISQAPLGKITFRYDCTLWTDSSGNINSNLILPPGWFTLTLSGFKTWTTTQKVQNISYQDQLFKDIFQNINTYTVDWTNLQNQSDIKNKILEASKNPKIQNLLFNNPCSNTYIENITFNVDNAVNNQITINFQYNGYENGYITPPSLTPTQKVSKQGTIIFTLKSINELEIFIQAGLEQYLQMEVDKAGGVFPDNQQLAKIIADYLNQPSIKQLMPISMLPKNSSNTFTTSDIIIKNFDRNQNPIIIPNATITTTTNLSIPEIRINTKNNNINIVTNNYSYEWWIWLVVGCSAAIVIILIIIIAYMAIKQKIDTRKSYLRVDDLRIN